jgi:hypothetical protein
MAGRNLATLTNVLIVIRTTLEEWRRLRWEELRLGEPQTAMLLLAGLLALALLVRLVLGLIL